MNVIKVISVVIGILLLCFGFTTNTHPYDYMACVLGGAFLSAAIK